jgi:hypothetical protein
MNSKENLEHIRNIILQNLQSLQGAPSVQFQEVERDRDSISQYRHMYYDTVYSGSIKN